MQKFLPRFSLLDRLWYALNHQRCEKRVSAIETISNICIDQELYVHMTFVQRQQSSDSSGNNAGDGGGLVFSVKEAGINVDSVGAR